MKIIVQHRDGRRWTISVEGGVKIVEGDESDCIVTDGGIEHLFSKDGHYEGWVRTAPNSERTGDKTREGEQWLVVRMLTSRVQ